MTMAAQNDNGPRRIEGLYDDKVAAMLGPLVYGGLVLLTGQTRLALLSLTIFFVLGGVLLSFVNVGRGRADAARPA